MRILLLSGLVLAFSQCTTAEAQTAEAQTAPGTSSDLNAQIAHGQNNLALLNYIRNWTPERRERAERLTVLANAGQCRQAVQIARDEDDGSMADALVVACEERFERADRLASAANAGNCDRAVETARRERDTPMAEVLAEICERVQVARRDASPEALAAAAARTPTPLDLSSFLVGEWAEDCQQSGGRTIYRADGTVRINSRQGRWSIENGLLIEVFRVMIPGEVGFAKRLTQHSRIDAENQYGLRKQVVFRNPGAFPPEAYLYRCED